MSVVAVEEKNEALESLKKANRIDLEKFRVCPGCMRFLLVPLYVRLKEGQFVEIQEYYCLSCAWGCRYDEYEGELPPIGREE